jgi:hypothetical protein
MSKKYTNIFHCMTPLNVPNLRFLAWKYTIWQPWFYGSTQIKWKVPEFVKCLSRFANHGSSKIFQMLRRKKIRPVFDPLPFVCLGQFQWRAGLPDGLFSNSKSQFGLFLEGLRLENVDIIMSIWNILLSFGIFYDHLVHFVFIWYILCSFGTFCVPLGSTFFPVWYHVPSKIWQPWWRTFFLSLIKKTKLLS